MADQSIGELRPETFEDLTDLHLTEILVLVENKLNELRKGAAFWQKIKEDVPYQLTIEKIERFGMYATLLKDKIKER